MLFDLNLIHFEDFVLTTFFSQVQFNLFEAFAGNKDDSLDVKDTANKRYILCRDIEEPYAKQAGGATKGDATDLLHPRFYNLAMADYSTQVCSQKKLNSSILFATIVTF